MDKLGFTRDYYVRYNGEVLYYTWEGKVKIKDKHKVEYLNIKGFNAVRVGINKDIAFRYNRECALFYDLNNNLLTHWKGTQVYPILNCPVQMDFDIDEMEEECIYIRDRIVYPIMIEYPHPYRGNKELRSYFNGNLNYKAKEIFISLNKKEVEDKDIEHIGYWSRISSWLPWMQLRDNNNKGFSNDTKLTFHVKIYKLNHLNFNLIDKDLGEFILKNINLELPKSLTDEKNMSSLLNQNIVNIYI